LLGSAARLRTLISQSVFVLALGFIYFILYGWLLLRSGGLPYVTDNNESFSVFIHSRNLFTFGVDKSFGLADESDSPSPDAHPFVYTHQGLFSRLFGFVMYALGARTIQSQIVVSTLTVGFASVMMAFAYFGRISPRPIASIICLTFATDYVFFAQWQVVTYRVWHGFFLFGALLCVHRLAGESWRLWRLVILVLFAGVFYFHALFGLFLFVFRAAYALLVYRAWRRALARVWVPQFAGLVASLLVLISQDVLYSGWDGFAQDLRYTYLARNVVLDPDLMSSMRTFYSSHS
jgi:hypothetical protein